MFPIVLNNFSLIASFLAQILTILSLSLTSWTIVQFFLLSLLMWLVICLNKCPLDLAQIAPISIFYFFFSSARVSLATLFRCKSKRSFSCASSHFFKFYSTFSQLSLTFICTQCRLASSTPSIFRISLNFLSSSLPMSVPFSLLTLIFQHLIVVLLFTFCGFIQH